MGQILNTTPILNSCLLVAIALCTSRPCLAEESLSPGPALKARQILHDKIQLAKSQGIGIAGYQNALAEMEQKVASGCTESEIQTQVESIDRAISDQIVRAKLLKSQRPSTTHNSSLPIPPINLMPSGERRHYFEMEANRLHAEMMADPETVRKLKADTGNATSIVMQKIMSDQQAMKVVMQEALKRARREPADK